MISVALALVLLGCSKNTASKSSSEPPVVERLTGLNGRFERNPTTQVWSYTDSGIIEEILRGNDPHELVKTLVSCLDAQRPSQSILGDRLAPIAAVCYQALRQTAYYEPTSPSGDVAQKWDGNVSPDATPKTWEDAQRAWRKIMENRAYILH